MHKINPHKILLAPGIHNLVICWNSVVTFVDLLSAQKSENARYSDMEGPARLLQLVKYTSLNLFRYDVKFPLPIWERQRRVSKISRYFGGNILTDIFRLRKYTLKGYPASTASTAQSP
jgi:uncharacterized membrane protein YkvI